jgi:uncharacterized protein YbjT (DUF2867 family)
MRILLLGASGMIGQGVLRECLLDVGVEQVLSIARSPTPSPSPVPSSATSPVSRTKLREIIHPDLSEFASLRDQLTGLDACFFCLGISSAGMAEAEYARITYGITSALAEVLVQTSPQLTFVYVSGMGTDSSEHGTSMWARVKGRTENHLLALGFAGAYMFRPGMVQPLHGITSKTRLYRLLYVLLWPVMPLLRRCFPRAITTTEAMGRAMLQVARTGYPRRIIENRDIATLAG